MPCCAEEAPSRTLAALEGQTYPRNLFEVVVVDAGSPAPVAQPASTPLDVTLVPRKDAGSGLARARNAGVRAAAHDVLVFLDGDMLPGAGWLAAHARWHHMVPDAVTLGLPACLAADGSDAGAIRKRTATLEDLFPGRNVDRPWDEDYLSVTGDLTTRADDPFRVVSGANLGIGRGFYELTGGFDDSFTQRGMEDTEFGYRAYTRGGLLVPVRDAFAWHQGSWEAGREESTRSHDLQRAQATHLIAHPGFRTGLSGRIFKVPQYVVTVRGNDVSADRLLATVERLLSGPMDDLVVRVELRPDHEGRTWLERHLRPDPRVRVAPSASALEEFPASSFHVTLPAGIELHSDVIRRLRAELGVAAVGRSVFPDGSRASIVRAWALHRASRTRWDAGAFGDVVRIAPERLSPERAVGGPATEDGLWPPPRRARAIPVRARPLYWTPPAFPQRAEYALGIEVVALGARAQAVFRLSSRVARTACGQHADVALADTAAEAAAVETPTVVLAEAPPRLSVPAVDPRADNPIGWERGDRRTVAALGPLDRLPPSCPADWAVAREESCELQQTLQRYQVSLRSVHHLEDVRAFHGDTVTRAGELVRLAASGVVVHLADGDRQLAPYLGAELFELMTGDVRDMGADGREALSIRMRRAALREHSLRSRARQVAERALADPPRLPLVSVLLVTRRPELLERALGAVRRQSYPRLELILGLHGEGFGDVGSDAAGPSTRVTVLRLDAALPLGAALNAATEEARGLLVTKMDDDDVYGPDHVWDLVLAQEYSQAPLVGKGAEFLYLAASDRTIRRPTGGAEQFETVGSLIEGAALLVTRAVLERRGGWKRSRRAVERDLVDDVVRAGDRVYRTHTHGFLLVRHGRGHAWDIDDAYFLATADIVESGWRPDLAGLAGEPRVYA